jgi:C-terminal processing protease CtpA/Prc
MRLNNFLAFLYLVCFCFVVFSCTKTEQSGTVLPEPADSIQRINKWILDSMNKYYLGSDQFGSNISLTQDPQDLFQSLLQNTDHYSWISNGVNIGPEKNTYERFGFHYIIVQHPALSDKLVGLVTLVCPGGPAATGGMKRGNYFLKVNGQYINDINIDRIVNELEASNCKITPAAYQNNVWTENTQISLSSRYFEERPVFSKRVFKQGGVNTGYLFYNNFAEFFDKDLLDALDSIRANNVTELILDLRYNPGGSVATAAKMSTVMLGSHVNSSTIFVRYKGNSKWGTVEQSFEKTLATSGNAYRKDFSSLMANGLRLNRIFILSGRSTASAAEMVINNLKPYINVVHIGEKTYGKNKAGLLIKDLRQPKQIFWYMQPMVFEIFNAKNQGGYSEGIVPDYNVLEYSQLPIYDLGNNNDLLIASALKLIYGTNSVNAQTLRSNMKVFDISESDVRYNSIKVKPGELVMIEKPK